MCLNRKFTDAAKDAQKDVFEACNIARKILAHKTQLSLSTVDKHANGDSVMNIAAFNGYAKAGVDPELLSLLLPDGFQIVRTPEGVNHDDLAAMMHDWLAAKTAAHHPDSPGGREISDCEKTKLNTKAAGLRAVGS